MHWALLMWELTRRGKELLRWVRQCVVPCAALAWSWSASPTSGSDPTPSPVVRMSEDHSEVLANLVAITGADEAVALNMLEATDWRLDEAVNLFFATNDGQGGIWIALAPNWGLACACRPWSRCGRSASRWKLHAPALA